MWRSISEHWFLYLLAICVAIGFSFPGWFALLAHSTLLRHGIVVFVMVLMGWTLQPHTVTRSLRRPLPLIIAIGVNVLVVPLLAWPSLWILPSGLAGGLVVASLVPCTLASASVWTRAAGGDDAVAMVTTVVTNLACFVIAPLGIWLLLRQQVETDVNDQVWSLFLLVVLPLVIGQLLRRLGMAAFADRQKAKIAASAQLGVLFMVLLGSVISAERMRAEDNPANSLSAILLTLLFAVGIHLLALAVGYYVSAWAGAERPQQLGVAIAGGQKTLMVGLQLALACGVSVLPMVMYHIGQLFLDTLLVRHWQGMPRDESSSAAALSTEVPEAEQLAAQPWSSKKPR